jgi:fructose-1,6-bisphosphatase/inositol monophosphatase family enzyme
MDFGQSRTVTTSYLLGWMSRDEREPGVHRHRLPGLACQPMEIASIIARQPSEIGARLACLLQVAGDAAQLTVSYFQSDRVRVDLKSDESPVTQADREAERLIRETVTAAFPGDGFIGEEEGSSADTTGFRWVIDPIDGTVSFAAGVPLYGWLIGIERTLVDGSRRVVAGVASMPALRERVWAVEGGGDSLAAHAATHAAMLRCIGGAGA